MSGALFRTATDVRPSQHRKKPENPISTSRCLRYARIKHISVSRDRFWQNEAKIVNVFNDQVATSGGLSADPRRRSLQATRHERALRCHDRPCRQAVRQRQSSSAQEDFSIEPGRTTALNARPIGELTRLLGSWLLPETSSATSKLSTVGTKCPRSNGPAIGASLL